MTKLNPVSVLEIDLDAVLHNLRYFESKLQRHTKVLAVVKSFSYGLDAVAIAQFLEKNKQLKYQLYWIRLKTSMKN